MYLYVFYLKIKRSARIFVGIFFVNCWRHSNEQFKQKKNIELNEPKQNNIKWFNSIHVLTYSLCRV